MQYQDPFVPMVYDYFVIMRFPPDGRDVLNLQGHDACFSAKLLEDGTGMVVTEPLLPSYLWQNLAELNDQDPLPKEMKIDILGKVQAYKESAEQYRRTTIYFPDGIIGTTELIGADYESIDRRTDLELFSNIFHCPIKSVTDEDDGNVLCYYAYWKIGVKGTTKKVKLAREIDLDSTAQKFKNLNLTTKKASQSKKDGDTEMNGGGALTDAF
jgi:hypothetical protein